MTRPIRIDLIESHDAPGPSGGTRAATYYVFRVGEKEVSVEVHSSARMTRHGNLAPQEVRIAARAFVEKEIQKRGSAVGHNLVLDTHQMDAIVGHLGWPSRF